jgi:predicted nuclease of predicted toxin-antitoxin system
MRFKVDESLHVEIADLLRERGHDALTVFDQEARGRSDRDIADLSRTEGRVLISLDLDFILSPREIPWPDRLTVAKEKPIGSSPGYHPRNGPLK